MRAHNVTTHNELNKLLQWSSSYYCHQAGTRLSLAPLGLVFWGRDITLYNRGHTTEGELLL